MGGSGAVGGGDTAERGAGVELATLRTWARCAALPLRGEVRGG